MRTYYVSLYNRDEKLDLRSKKREMKEVLDYLSKSKEQKDVSKAEIISIEQHSMQIEVEETGKNWHKRFGNILANNFGMREFCHQNDSSRLFKWN